MTPEEEIQAALKSQNGTSPEQEIGNALNRAPQGPGLVQGLKDAATYAGDVWQTPKVALWKAIDQFQGLTGIDSKQETAAKMKAYQEWMAKKAEDRAKIKYPILTDILANPLSYVLPSASKAGPAVGTGYQAVQQAPAIAGKVWAANMGKNAAIANAMSTMDPEATPTSVAVATTAGAVVPKSVEWLGEKVANRLAGTRLGDRLGIKTELNPKYKGAPELSQQLDEAGIEHTVGDITSDPKVLSYEAAMARKDPRMMDLRVRQNQQGLRHAEKVVSDLKAAVDSEGWQGVDDLVAAVERKGKRSGEAQALLTAIENSGEDWQKIAKNSGNLKLLVNKLKADQLYDTAEAIARQYGPVKVDKLSGSIKSNVSNIQRTLGADDSIVPYLEKIQAGIDEGKGLDFASLRQTRSILNRKISGLNKPNAAVQDADGARSALQNVVKALEKDLDKYANSHSSGLRNSWKQATEFYKTNVVPYKDKELGKVLADEDPAALGRLFAGKDTFEQRKLFNAIGTKGQKAIQWGLIDDAISAGEKTQRGAMAPTFSAAQAASKLESILNRGTHDVAFGSNPDKWAVKGLARILRTIDKSDTIAWIPPTGESVERLGSDAMKGQLTTLGVVEKATNWISKERLFQLYTNPKGRALLQRASSLEPGSAAMNRLITNDLPRVAVSTSGSAVAPKNVKPFVPSEAIPQAADNGQPPIPPMAVLP